MPGARYIWIALFLMPCPAAGQQLPESPGSVIIAQKQSSVLPASIKTSPESIELEPSKRLASGYFTHQCGEITPGFVHVE